MIIRIIKNCYKQIYKTLDELRSGREAVVSYHEWKRDPTVARPFDEVDAELGAEHKPNG